MFNIAICDDNAMTCVKIESILLDYQKECLQTIDVDVYFSAEELFRFIKSGEKYNLIFLDIEFKKFNGIEIGKKIRNDLLDEFTQIVYISAKQEYAMELFQIRPMNFLVKPLQNVDIINTVKKAMELSQNKTIFFEFKIRKNHYRLPIKDILYFESETKKIRVVIYNETYEFYGKMSEVRKVVPSKNFLVIHKSYLVNAIYITEHRYDSIKLTNGVCLPISQPYRKEIRRMLLHNMAGRTI